MASPSAAAAVVVQRATAGGRLVSGSGGGLDRGIVPIRPRRRCRRARRRTAAKRGPGQRRVCEERRVTGTLMIAGSRGSTNSDVRPTSWAGSGRSPAPAGQTTTTGVPTWAKSQTKAASRLAWRNDSRPTAGCRVRRRSGRASCPRRATGWRGNRIRPDAVFSRRRLRGRYAFKFHAGRLLRPAVTSRACRGARCASCCPRSATTG